MSAYDVVWNGVNDGRDGDLLAAQLRQPEKQIGRLVAPARARPGRLLVLDVLPALRMNAIDFKQLRARTGLGKQTLNSALCTLRQRGQLASEPLDGASRRFRPPQRYWRIA